jgi:hypothetical protein
VFEDVFLELLQLTLVFMKNNTPGEKKCTQL